MTVLGIAQLAMLLVCAIGTCFYLGMARHRNDGGLLLLLGALFVVPTVAVGAFTLQEYSAQELFMQGKAGITFALPLGVGIGFVLSAGGAFLRRKSGVESSSDQE